MHGMVSIQKVKPMKLTGTSELVRLICAGEGNRKLIFHLFPDEITNAKAKLTSWNIGDDAFLIGIHPGGSSFDKRWPEEQYAELADRLAHTTTMRRYSFYGVLKKQNWCTTSKRRCNSRHHNLRTRDDSRVGCAIILLRFGRL